LKLGLGVYAEEPSGLAVATVDTALALQQAGADVTLFAAAGSRLPDRAQPLADRVVRLAPPPALLERPGVETALFLASKLALAGRLAQSLESNPVDAIHVFSPGMAARVPKGVRVTAQAWFHPPRLAARLRTLMPFVSRPALYPAGLVVQAQSHLADLAGYRRADLVIANTEAARREMESRGFRATCVPPAISVGEGPIAREPSEAFRVAFCSHPLNLRRKGLRFLLEALALVRHRPLEVTLVGGPDPQFDAPIEAARRAGVKVTPVGRVAREEYLRLLAMGTDLLAFPSLYEEWGYALFEALSEGVPALAFDLYPFSEIVDDDTGVLVPPRDARALAAAIDRAASGALPRPGTVREATRARFGSAVVAERLLEACA
jgi:glycosyltransferase involved in cell wall biosynthesis